MKDNYIIEISSNILVEENIANTIMNNEIVISVNNDFNSNCFYRRSFLDADLNMVTIDLPIEINSKRLLEITDIIRNNHPEYKRNTWDILKFNSSIALDFSYEDLTYDIPLDSELGKEIINITDLEKFLSYSNKEIIKLIKI